MTREELLKNLPIGAFGILATVKADGMPEARCMGFEFEEDGKIYFATSNYKEVYKQLKENPKCAYAYVEPKGKYTVRITGIMKFVDDKAEHKRVWDKLNRMVKGLHKTWESDSLMIMYMDECEGKFSKGLGPVTVVDWN